MSDLATGAKAAPPNTNLCPHFGDCGGCDTQNVSYAGQLASKQQHLRELFAELWTDDIPIIGSPILWHYRNKVDFNFGLKHYAEPPPKDFLRETVLGFTRRGQWYNPLDVETCLIAPEGCDTLLRATREWYCAEDLHGFDSRSGKGFLRALLVREGKRTGERMVALFTSEGMWKPESFLRMIEEAYPAQAVFRGTFSRSAHGAFADRIERLAGSDYIREEMRIPDSRGDRRLRFRISPQSFFQTNTLAAELLYGEIRDWVRKSGARILYDLYGGAGGVAFSCADAVQVVRSVESEAAATADGQYNATLNGIDNVFFATERMRPYLHALLDTGGMEPNSVVVADPPRGGMTPKPIQRLIDCAPPRILYVSCKASVLREELPAFLKAYRLDRLWAVDMFPHTPHVEVMASLSRR